MGTIFANSTCYDDTIMEQLARKAAVEKGTIFITLTKKVPSKEFQVLEHRSIRCHGEARRFSLAKKSRTPKSKAFRGSRLGEDCDLS